MSTPTLSAHPSIAESLQWAAALLKPHVEAPWQDARLLLRTVLGTQPAHLITHAEETVREEAALQFRTWIERRAQGEPLQYIRGIQEFYGREFSVSPVVLIPRPETEVLVEQAIAALDCSGKDRRRVLEIGTGSGCVAITLGLERPDSGITATDISPEALLVARQNAIHLNVSNVVFEECDVWPEEREKYDLLVSNPPYVGLNSNEIEAGVRDFEPHIALFAGQDGLSFFRRLFGSAGAWVQPQGRMIIEMGYDQRDSITSLASQEGWVVEDVFHDLAGKERVLSLRAQLSTCGD